MSGRRDMLNNMLTFFFGVLAAYFLTGATWVAFMLIRSGFPHSDDGRVDYGIMGFAFAMWPVTVWWMLTDGDD